MVRRLDSDIIALQSTGSQWGWPLRQEGQSCYLKNLPDHIACIWPRTVSDYVTTHCGVIIALRRKLFPRSSIIRIYNPPAQLEGRAGALRIRLHKGMDFTVFSMYLPPSSSANALHIAQCLFDWCSEVLADLPGRSLPLICLDANARLGSFPLFAPDGASLVGRWGRSRENAAGRQFRNFLLINRLAAVNTLFRGSAGPTWFNTQGHRARVDYIFTIPEALQKLRRAEWLCVWVSTFNYHTLLHWQITVQLFGGLFTRSLCRELDHTSFPRDLRWKICMLQALKAVLSHQN